MSPICSPKSAHATAPQAVVFADESGLVQAGDDYALRQRRYVAYEPILSVSPGLSHTLSVTGAALGLFLPIRERTGDAREHCQY
jgi:hypothetical protein